MTLDLAEKICKSYKLTGIFKGFKAECSRPAFFSLAISPDPLPACVLRVQIQVPTAQSDSYEFLGVNSHFDQVTWDLMTERALRQRIEAEARGLVLHEVDESFFYEGKPVRDPHPPEPVREHPKRTTA